MHLGFLKVSFVIQRWTLLLIWKYRRFNFFSIQIKIKTSVSFSFESVSHLDIEKLCIKGQEASFREPFRMFCGPHNLLLG